MIIKITAIILQIEKYFRRKEIKQQKIISYKKRQKERKEKLEYIKERYQPKVKKSQLPSGIEIE